MIQSTQCNRCISGGGGDCATCMPEAKDVYTLYHLIVSSMEWK